MNGQLADITLLHYRELGTEDESWTLKVEKRILSTRTLSLDETDTDSDLIQTVRSSVVCRQCVCARMRARARVCVCV